MNNDDHNLQIIKYSENNMKKQYLFPFPKSIRKYLLKNGSAANIRKLYQTCKYFYYKYPFFIVDSIIFDDDKQRFENLEKKFDDCFEIQEPGDLEMIENGIWLNQKLIIDSPWGFGETMARSMLAKICWCEAKEISITRFDLSFKEYIILTNLRKVEILNLQNVTVTDEENGFIVSLEALLSYARNAKSISISPCYITHETMEEILSIPWKYKLNKFVIEDLKANIDIDLYIEFIQKHVEINGIIALSFQNNDYKSEIFENVYNNKLIEMKELNIPKLDRFVKLDKKLEALIPTNITYNSKNMKHRQPFSLPYNFMNYIIEKANGKIMKKFQRTCKYFFNKIPAFIIEDISFGGAEHLLKIDETIEIPIKTFDDFKVFSKKLWIIGEINFNCINIRPLLPNIYRCDAMDICLQDNILPFKDFDFLTKSKSVKAWYSQSLDIVDDKGKLSALEDVLPNLINGENIGLGECATTPETMKTLLSFPWKNKINRFYIDGIKGTLNVDLFYQFLKKALAPKAYVELHFWEFDGDEEFSKKFALEMKEKLKEWKPKCDRPSVKINPVKDI